MNFSGRSFESCEGRSRVYGSWKVGNSTGHNGNMDMYSGAAWSVNTYFVQLALDTGMCRVTKMAERLGVKSGSRDRDIVDFYNDKPAFTLGSVEVSPLSMAEAYATFAARGIHCNPVIVSEITTRTGQSSSRSARTASEWSPRTSPTASTDCSTRVMTSGTGARARIPDGRSQAGKTGTIDSNEAVWFAGYTPEIAGVAMISIDNRKKPFIRGKYPYKGSGVKGYRVPSSGIYLEGSGSGDAGMKIWRPVMSSYLKDKPRTSFKAPPNKILHGKITRVPYIGGLSISSATDKLQKEGFSVVRQFVYSNSTPKYGFIGWSPGSGGRISEFGSVTALFSKGRDPADIRAEREAAARKRDAAEKKQKEAEKKKKEQQQKKDDGGG